MTNLVLVGAVLLFVVSGTVALVGSGTTTNPAQPTSAEEAALEAILTEGTPIRGFMTTHEFDVEGCVIQERKKFARSCHGSGAEGILQTDKIIDMKELSYGYFEDVRHYYIEVDGNFSFIWPMKAKISEKMIEIMKEIDSVRKDYNTYPERRSHSLEYMNRELDHYEILSRSTITNCDGESPGIFPTQLRLSGATSSVRFMGAAIIDYHSKFCRAQ